MKRLVALAGLGLMMLAPQARAEGPDDEYVHIYNVIQQGDASSASGQVAQALASYEEAQISLKRLQKTYPEWHVNVVNYRLNYLAAKIAAVTSKTLPAAGPPPAVSPPAATPLPAITAPSVAPTVAASAELERQLSALQNEVRRLQSDKTMLEAKLKEAFATQPAVVDPRELAVAQERIRSLLKENELLKASLTQPQAQPAASDAKALAEAKQALVEANRTLAAQTETANALAVEKKVLQGRLESLAASRPNPGMSDSTRKALDDANRRLTEQTDQANKLALEKEALQSRVRTLTASAETAEALRAENNLLKQQVASLKAPTPASDQPEDLSRKLAKAEAQIAALRSDAEILRLEKIALQNRVKTLSAAPNTTPVLSPASRPENTERLKKLTQERDDLQQKLDVANKELSVRPAKAAAAKIEELSNQIAVLRARLDVFEAQQVPYTSEEIALFNKPEPRLAADPKAGKASVKALPAGTVALVAEAQRYFSAKQFDQAEERYLEVLRQDDKNVYTLANLAAIELERGRLDTAEQHIKQALDVAPDDAYSLSILGYLRFRQEKFDEALDALSRAAKLNPQNAEIQNYLGVTLSHKGLRGPAETALRKAIQLEPNYGSAHNNLAVIYVTQQPPLVELARWHYQQALAAGHPRNPELEKMLEEKKAAGSLP
jgi:Flp pilus assembly protein TadD